MKYNIPFNWDHKMLDFICKNKQYIDSVYGSLLGTPGGRPIPYTDNIQAKPSHSSLGDVIATLTMNGIDFHYTYNMSSTGNVLLTQKGRESFKSEIERLYEKGVRTITVANFGLARFISSIKPDINIMISVILNINNITQITYLEMQDFNFKGVVLGKDLVRRFPILQSISKKLKLKGLKVYVIANDFCPFAKCPERISDHNNTCSHKSLPFDSSLGDQEYISPSLHCKKLVLEEPSMYLAAPIINPNDVPFYDDIGIEFLKITDRVMNTDQLTEVCNAYFSGYYDGNYFDLFSYTSDFNMGIKGDKELTLSEVQEVLKGGHNLIREHRRSFTYKPTLSALGLHKSDFLGHFQAGKCDYNCYNKEYNSTGCRHCKKYTDRLVEFNYTKMTSIRNNIDNLLKESLKC